LPAASDEELAAVCATKEELLPVDAPTPSGSTEVNPPTRTPVEAGVVDLEELGAGVVALEELVEIEPPVALNEFVTISSTNIKSCLLCSKAKVVTFAHTGFSALHFRSQPNKTTMMNALPP
jgi:hypothetical protein